DDHVRRSPSSVGANACHSGDALENGGARRHAPSERREIIEIAGGKTVGHPNGSFSVDRLPPRRHEHPLRIVGDLAVLPRRPAGRERILAEDQPDAQPRKRESTPWPYGAAERWYETDGRFDERDVPERYRNERQDD